MKHILIISSSPRKDGNSETLAKEFGLGALSAGNSVDYIFLRDYNLGYCHGCYVCSSTGKCFQKDGMNELAEKVLAADVIVLATPVYFYCMSGQMKVFIDRLVPYYIKVRADIYLMCTAADTDMKLLEKALDSIRGCTSDCFEDCPEKGAMIVGGVSGKGDIEGRTELREAFDMGRGC